MTALADLKRFGKYVVPYSLEYNGGPPRGFVFDGDSGVPDLDHETAARHDWDYFQGASKVMADARYACGYVRDQRPIRAIIRWIGLTAFGWLAYYRHRDDAKRRPNVIRLRERMVDPDQWDWTVAVRSWLLADLRPRMPDHFRDANPDD